MQNPRWMVAAVSAAALTTACSTVGPTSIRNARFDYNQAIIQTQHEQMLANLVRLRYRDPPYFLQVASVSTQYVFRGSADAGVSTGSSIIGDASVGAGVGYEERPTVTYQPLTGEEFAVNLLRPIGMESILLLSSSGWRADRLLRCCVQRVNDLRNAPRASGPTPALVPEYEDFLELSGLIQRLSEIGASEVQIRPVEDGPDGFDLFLVFRARPDSEAELARVRTLLELSDATEYRLTSNPTFREPDEIAILPRSLMGTLYYLSQAVEPPQRDIDAGRVTITRTGDGSVFEWSELTGGLFRVRSSLEPPENAFVRIRYRDAWFYIDDADLTSKSTFQLLEQLFQLQAGQAGSGGPLLTLPVGN
jgi:hypothetical protein